MTRLLSFALVVIFSTFALTVAAPAHAAAMTEQQKIDALLDSLDKPGITLIRNGEEHDGAWAKKHFQDKLKEVKDVKTADDFINNVATKSRESGKPYVIKQDGKETESGKWLHDKMAEIEKQNK